MRASISRRVSVFDSSPSLAEKLCLLILLLLVSMFRGVSSFTGISSFTGVSSFTSFCYFTSFAMGISTFLKAERELYDSSVFTTKEWLYNLFFLSNKIDDLSDTLEWLETLLGIYTSFQSVQAMFSFFFSSYDFFILS